MSVEGPGEITYEAGSNIHLTIDAEVQKAADEGLRKSVTGRGAAVAIDPRTGEILAMSSQPDFDPNALLSTDPEEVKRSSRDMPGRKGCARWNVASAASVCSRSFA